MKNLTLIVSFILLFAVGCDTSTDPKDATDFTVTIENISTAKLYSDSGVFNTPAGGTSPAPIFPGEAYEVSFDAAPGSKLSFATMFVQSNDLFYAPDGDGIELFDAMGNQITGDITDQIMLWDSGTEINQEPGLGADQAPRQAMANAGAGDPDNTVRLATDDFNNLPAVSDVIEVSLSSSSETGFVLHIENVSTASTLMTSGGGSTAVPLAPGVYVIHTNSNVLFTAGQSDDGNGLEAIAEDGDPSGLASILANETGITQLIAPGVYVVHESGTPLFTANVADNGSGLENLAEDGDPAVLAASLENDEMLSEVGAFTTPIGTSAPAPVGPGESYSFTVSAMGGDHMSFATMLVQSNDLFLAPDDMGLALFDGSPLSGDITSQFMIWDAGTEVNEIPGIGLNQAPRQSGVNTGDNEMGTVQLVDDGFSYPTVDEIVRITITPL